MIKRLFIIFALLFFTFWSLDFVFSAWPTVNCEWLPGCNGWTTEDWKTAITWFLGSLVADIISYIAVVAVISVMFGWIMYLLSWWEEEKVNKAKKWIIWSLVWVFLSVSAYWIVNFISKFSIAGKL